ncbi:MAG: histidine kinase [Bacteroidia bacterium]
MKKLKPLLILSVFLVFQIVVVAQTQFYSLEQKLPLAKNYSVANGLPTNEVYQTIQDKNGLIWFCTDKGVVSFNGSKFKIYDRGKGLIENAVIRAKKDDKDNLWFFTINDNFFSIQDKIITHPYKDYLKRDGYKLTDFKVKDFCVYKDTLHLLCSRPWKGTYYIQATQDTVVVKEIKEPQASIIRIKIGKQFLVSLNYNFKGTETLYANREGSIYYLGNPIHNEWIKANNSLFEAWRLEYFISDSLNYYSIEKSLFKFDDDSFKEDYQNEIYNIWHNSKALYLSQAQHLLERETQSNKHHHLLKNKRPCSIMADDKNNIWITTLNYGVYFLPNTSTHIIFSQDENAPDLNFALNHNKHILLGQKDGKLLTYNSITNAKTEVTCSKYNQPIDDITHINDNNYLLTYSGNNFIYNLAQDNCTPLHFGSKPNLLNRINENLLFGIRKSTGGISLFNNNFDLLYRSLDKKKPNNPIKYRTYFSFYDSIDQRMLLSTSGGLYTFNPTTTRSELHNEFKFLNKSIVSCIDRNTNKYAFGTQGEGPWIYYDNKVIRTTGQLSHAHINCIKFLDSNLIAVGTNTGLYYLKLENDSLLPFRHIDNSNSLIGNSVFQITMNKKGKLIVLTNRALVELPLNLFEPAKSTTLIFDGFFLDENEAILDTTISIKDNKNLFARFSSINYLNSHNMTYGYRLNPMSDKWTYTNDPFLDISAFRPGDYNIQFAVFNKLNKLKASRIQNLIIKIHEPLYSTVIFIILMALLGVFITIFTARLVINRIRKQAMLQNQIIEIEAQALRSQMNPHFFFNILNSIQSFIALNEKKQAYNYISKFATLVRTYLNQTSVSTVYLEDELETLRSYIELEKMRLDHKFDYKFDFDPKIKDRLSELSVPAMLFQPIVENAIMHGIRHLEKDGLLTISIKDEGKFFCVCVIDNGIGLDRSKALEKKKKNHKSLGIQNIHRRVELINSTIKNAISFGLNETSIGTVASFKLSYSAYEKFN